MSFFSTIKTWLIRFVLLGLFTTVLICCLIGYLWWYYTPQVTRTNGVVYGKRGNAQLTMDILQPSRPNGKAIAFMVSGGWKSQKAGDPPAWMMAPLLRRGYTIFAICHISQPDSTVMEIIEDMNRGIRFIRHHADDYKIDSQQIGVTGGSAGGHLSLMLATRGGPGSPQAEDPIDRQSSAVQAVAIFYPVTDLLNLGDSTENPGDGGPPKSFVKAFGPGATNMEQWKQIGADCSPIYHIHDQLPPTLIYHGDADTLVPLDQSLRFQEKAVEQKREVKVVVHRKGAHGWPSMILDIEHFGDWFDKYLK